MLRPRIVPCLLVHQKGLVKTVEFKNPKYVGDPINAVKIFNEKEADELMVIDIDATVQNREPDYKMIANLATECRMPLCYGGGVNSVEQVKKIISLGVEKVAISSVAINNPSIIGEMAKAVGSQSVVVVMDFRKRKGILASGYELCTHNAKKSHQVDIFDFAKNMQIAGAGEIVLNSVDKDGMMNGYDLPIALKMRETVQIPITFLGGAGSLQDIELLLKTCGVVGAAAGSLFVFKGQFRAVLINYPNSIQKDAMCKSAYQ